MSIFLWPQCWETVKRGPAKKPGGRVVSFLSPPNIDQVELCTYPVLLPDFLVFQEKLGIQIVLLIFKFINILIFGKTNTVM